MNTIRILLLVFLLITETFTHISDIPGDYCKARTDDNCCDGRIDECSVPILGTLCYCDQFCNRTINPDCCPDYWRVCLGIGSIITGSDCLLNGEYIPHLETKKRNCNECKCTNGKVACTTDPCLIDEQLLRMFEANFALYPWSVANYSMFWGKKLNQGLLRLTGTLLPGKMTSFMYPVTLFYDSEDIPSEFDSRQKWPGLIDGVRDQRNCGASWAFSTISVAQDRLTIETKGKIKPTLSVQNLISCNRRGQQACNGGHVEIAWNYLRRRGVTSESCYPYSSGFTGSQEMCLVPAIPTEDFMCLNQITPKAAKMYKWEPSYRIASKEEDIMYEIMTNGPVQAIMRVYQDFVMYKEGIYTRRQLGFNGNFLLHSVRLIGWGEEFARNGFKMKYWLAANSWGENWGEKGFFKIQRGANESDIEHFIFAARARLEIRRRRFRK